jgi:hypothetical protein
MNRVIDDKCWTFTRGLALIALLAWGCSTPRSEEPNSEDAAVAPPSSGGASGQAGATGGTNAPPPPTGGAGGSNQSATGGAGTGGTGAGGAVQGGGGSAGAGLPDAAPEPEPTPVDAAPGPGSIVWSQALPQVENLIEHGGAVFAAGHLNSTFEGQAPPPGRTDRYLTRFDLASGARTWLRRVRNTSAAVLTDVGDLAIDSDGTPLLQGYFEGTVDFGGKSLTASPDARYLARYAPADGALLGVRAGLGGKWSASLGSRIVIGHPYPYVFYRGLDDFTLGTVDLPEVHGAAFASDGSLFLGGSFFGSTTIGSTKLDAGDGYDGWVARLGPDGKPVWAVGCIGAETDINGVATDPQGDLFTGGLFRKTVSVGGRSFTSKGDYDVMVVKFAGSNGAIKWARAFGGAGDDRNYSVATAPDGTVVVAGSTSPGGTGEAPGIDIEGTSVTRPGFVLKLAGDDGHTIWISEIESYLQVVTVAPGGEILVGGDRGLARLRP